MPIPTDELKDQIEKLADSQAAMKDEIHSFRLEFVAFEAKILTTLSIMKWVGGIVGGILVINALNGVYWAGSLSADVRNLAKEVQTLNERVGELNKHALPAPGK